MSNLKTIMPVAMTLDQLGIGDSAVVGEVSTNENAASENTFDIARRLKELGFVKGEAVRILHRGYFGGEPLAVRVGESTFALRLFEAALIGVVPAGSI
jgi:ferrous iron transport protein A